MIVVDPLHIQKDRGLPPDSPDPFARGFSSQACDWRLNLIQLSAVYNLLFVADGPDILVFEPEFPTQRIPRDAPLVITTPPTSPYLRGYISPAQPHAINNLLVQKLGSDEVIVSVRDDGDVDAYWVRSIWDAHLKRHGPNNSLPRQAFELRPMLHRNVGNSAWGVAIHTEARLIAVSSNNHEFNLFYFAITSATGSKSNLGHGRDHNRHVRIKNGEANVPCISFCNTRHDPRGRWLLTTDIEGKVRTWDLNSATLTQGLSIACCTPIGSPFNLNHAGWNVAFMDPRSFVDRDHFQQHAELERACRVDILKQTMPVWDLSSMRPPGLVQSGNSGNSGFVRALGRISINGLSGSSNHGDYGQAEGPEDTTLALASPPLTLEEALAAGPPNAHRRLIPAPRRMMPPHRRMILDMDELEDEPLPSSDNVPPNPLVDVYIDFQGPQSFCPGIPCPIFHALRDNMWVLQPGTHSNHSLATNHFPVVLHRDPWVDHRGGISGLFEECKRTSLVQQIPELGVLVAGNQNGLVLVYSGFKTRQDVDFAVMSDSRVRTSKWVYGLKLEAVLPTSAQQEEGHLMDEQLYGLTVGPMQGSEDVAPDLKRWRVMLMYLDGGVFSYELRREGAAVAVDDIMI